MDSANSADELPVSEQTHAAGHVTPSMLQSRLLRTRRQPRVSAWRNAGRTHSSMGRHWAPFDCPDVDGGAQTTSAWRGGLQRSRRSRRGARGARDQAEHLLFVSEASGGESGRAAQIVLRVAKGGLALRVRRRLLSCGWPARPRRLTRATSRGASSQLRSGCALTPRFGPSRPHRLGRQPSHCRLHRHRSHPRSSSLGQPRRR